MSLPIIGGGPPPRPPTHTPLDLRRLMNVAAELEEAVDAAGGGPLDAARVEELAADIGASVGHIYAAAAMMTELPFDETAPIRFEVCAGGCQSWGAVEILTRLSVLHAQRREAEAPLFGIVARRCLDKCERAAVVLVKTPDGTAGMSQATVEQVEEAVAQALDG